MLFDQDFIEWVEENPIEGLIKAGDIALKKQKEFENNHAWTEAEHEILWDASTFIQLVLSINEIAVEASMPDATTDIGTNCRELMEYIEAVTTTLRGLATQLKINSYKNRYRAALKGAFAYEFSQGDLDRVQVLVNEIRTHIIENQSLEEGHKLRLLKRLEKLQLELHKRVSDLDRFWGLVGDAGIVLGKLGMDAKPIVDRVKEIAQITWKTQARAEELPSDSKNPMLGHDENA